MPDGTQSVINSYGFLNTALRALGVEGRTKVQPYRTKISNPRGGELLLYSLTSPVKSYAILSPHRGTEPIQVLSFSPCPVPEGSTALFMCPGALLLRKGRGFLDLRLGSVFPPQLVPPFTPAHFGGRRPRRTRFRALRRVLLAPPLFNHHAFSAALFLEALGLLPEKYPWPFKVGWVNTLVQKCLCDLPGKPKVWRIGEGLERVLKALGKRGRVRFKEVVGRGVEEALKRSIGRGKPCILTYVTNPKARGNAKRAIERRAGASVVCSGYLESPYGLFALVSEGLRGLKSPKWVPPKALSGIGLYNLRGLCVERVLVKPLP